MFSAQLIIDNNNTSANGNAVFERIGTSGAVSRAAAGQIADAAIAVESCARAFVDWSITGPTGRRNVLMKAADILEASYDKFYEVMMAETGCTKAWVNSNIKLGASMLREAGAITTQITGDIIPTDRPRSLSLAIRRPLGVVVGIAPWNAPVVLGIRAIAMAIACGNTVILKSSEICPATYWLIVDVLREAGLPPGVCNLISCAANDAKEVVHALISNPLVRHVNFTGSTRVGKIIAKTCAEYLKPVLLELGGKAPVVVLDDADLNEAACATVFGAFMNQGQICMSTERVVVDCRVADEFVARLAAKASLLVASYGETPIGALVDASAVKRAKMLVDDAISHGARVVAGGYLRETLMDATVIDLVTPEMLVYGEETFAPIVTIVRVDGLDEAVRTANDTEYGLASAVFGRNTDRALDVAARLETGICHINAATLYNEPQMPFGGMKASGYGRFGGKAAIDEFTELRWVTIQNGPVTYPI